MVREGIAVFSKDFIDEPTAKDLFKLYKDVYKWCGLEFKGFQKTGPRCKICFEQFIDEAIDTFLSDKFETDFIEEVKHQALLKYGAESVKKALKAKETSASQDDVTKGADIKTVSPTDRSKKRGQTKILAL